MTVYHSSCIHLRNYVSIYGSFWDLLPPHKRRGHHLSIFKRRQSRQTWGLTVDIAAVTSIFTIKPSSFSSLHLCLRLKVLAGANLPGGLRGLCQFTKIFTLHGCQRFVQSTVPGLCIQSCHGSIFVTGSSLIEDLRVCSCKSSWFWKNDMWGFFVTKTKNTVRNSKYNLSVIRSSEISSISFASLWETIKEAKNKRYELTEGTGLLCLRIDFTSKQIGHINYRYVPHIWVLKFKCMDLSRLITSVFSCIDIANGIDKICIYRSFWQL